MLIERFEQAFSGLLGPPSGAFLFVFTALTSTFAMILKSCGITVSCRQIVVNIRS
jgi:hypothetical protein